MPTLQQYLDQADERLNPPQVGDFFEIEINDTLLESYVVDVVEDGYVIAHDQRMLDLLQANNCTIDFHMHEQAEDELHEQERLFEAPCEECGRSPCECEDRKDVKEDSLARLLRMANVPVSENVEKVKLYANPLDEVEQGAAEKDLDEGARKKLMHADAGKMSLEQFCNRYGDEDWVKEFWHYINDDLDEAKYQGREVPLGKPMQGDVKKSKVYVRGPKGNVVKVNFGDKTMRIKKNIPGRRRNFRARHNCDNPGPRWKARFWSCRAW